MKRALICSFTLVVLAALPGSARSLGPAAPFSSGKVAPWVIEHTADGAQAEFLIVLAEQADLRGASAMPAGLERRRYVRDALWNAASAAQRPLLEWLAARKVEHRAYYVVNAIWVKGNRDVAMALAARPDVARVEGNPRISNVQHPLPTEDQISASQSPISIEPNITYVRAPEVWAMGLRGQGIVIGGQDTGYDWDHPALQSSYRGWDGAAAQHDYNWHDSIHSGGGVCGADAAQPCDDYGHGTHTMGTAVGDDGAGRQIGVAPGARWMGCRNMDRGVGTPATYLECFEFFLAPYPVNGTPAQGDPAYAPDVTVNSWNCPSYEGCAWDTLQAALEAQRAAGIMTVVSAGNSGPNCSTVHDPPAIYAAAYTVGALASGTDTLASFSSRGPVTADGSLRRKPDIAAPGTEICSSIPGGFYSCSYSGTSMAAPHVAGAVALLWSAYPALRNQISATEQILNDSAVHISSTECSSAGWPNNTFGYGRLDIKAAVDLPGVLTGVVRDGQTALPLAAIVQATSNGITMQAATNGAGQYTLVLSPGVYTVTAAYSGYGYYPAHVTGVQVSSQMTVTQDLALEPYERFSVSGVVSDAVSGLPLPGAVAFSGPLSYTAHASASGIYSATVVSGTYTLRATFDEYVPESRTVNVYGDQTQDFALRPCSLYTMPITGVDFTWLPQPVMAGRMITFTAVVTGGTEPLAYQWSVNGGTGSLLLPGARTMTHVFARAATYTVTLEVSDACSARTIARLVQVQTARLIFLPLVLKQAG